jgi:hypothetical protein
MNKGGFRNVNKGGFRYMKKRAVRLAPGPGHGHLLHAVSGIRGKAVRDGMRLPPTCGSAAPAACLRSGLPGCNWPPQRPKRTERKSLEPGSLDYLLPQYSRR